MSKPAAAPAWLEAYQARFSTMLRTPLDRAAGTLHARTSEYDDALCKEARGAGKLGPRERLAAYNQQYWFRLFGVLQHEHVLCARLLGAWSFNALAAAFLEEHPPRHHDLARAADGFSEYLERTLPAEGFALERERRTVPRRALLQAARMDDAFRAVFRAPEQPAFAPTSNDAERLERSRLRRSLAARSVEEDWPLLPLRDRASDVERAVPLPEPHAVPRHWMICRSPEGFRSVPLEPLAAKLMELLDERPVGQALAELEQRVPPAQRAELAARTQRWLAEGIRHGFWTGLDG